MRETMIYNPNYYQLRESILRRMLEILEANKSATQRGIVLYGDSLMEYFPTALLTSSLPIYNCGMAGCTSKELLLFVDEAVIKYNPSIVFLHAGTNDLGNTVMRSPREIATWLLECAKIILENLSGTKVYILSPLPCVEAKQAYTTLHKGLRSNDTLAMIYDEVKEQCFDKRIKLLHVFDIFFDSQQINEQLYEDGLHLNRQGYIRLSEKMQKKLPQ